MADILCNLKLFTGDYERNIRKSKQEMQDFEKKVSIAKVGVAKFMGVLGVGVTAGKAFNKWMRSSQTTSDEFDNTINAAKGSVDAFFTSLNTGNWDAFSGGLLTTFTRLKNLSALMDTIADMKLSLGYIKAEDLRNIEEYEAIARDTTLTMKERQDALSNMKTQIKDLNTNTAAYIETTTKGLQEQYKAQYGIDVTLDDLKTFARVTNFSDPKMLEEVEKYKKELEDLKKSFTVTTTTQSIAGSSTIKGFKPGYDEAVKAYEKQNASIRTQVVLLDEVDERRKATIGTLIENLGLEQQIESLNKRANRLNNSLSKGGGNSDIFVKGSLGAIDKDIADLEKKLKTASDAGTRDGIRQAIEELRKQKIAIELEGESNSIAGLRAKITNLKKDYENATEAGTRLGLNKAIEEAQKKLDRMIFASQMKIMSPGKSTVIGKSAKDDINSGKIKIKPIVDKNDVKLTDQYNEGLQQTLNTMLAISNATAEGAGSWIQYGVNTVTALNNTYQALAKVIPALRVKALYAGAASAAETPIIGWMTAIAAIGAMTAAFASIPKYETGGIVGMNGIVPGGMYVGDKVLARVNSGELILNRAQQRNIASQLVAGGGSSRVDVNVTGRISGRDIEFVLDKRNRFKSRTL